MRDGEQKISMFWLLICCCTLSLLYYRQLINFFLLRWITSVLVPPYIPFMCVHF
jgi:hypothetical protein